MSLSVCIFVWWVACLLAYLLICLFLLKRAVPTSFFYFLSIDKIKD